MCCALWCSGIYLMHQRGTWSAGQKDDGNQKEKDEESILVYWKWERCELQPSQRVPSSPWSPRGSLALVLGHPVCATQPPPPSCHQGRAAPRALVSAGWGAPGLAASPHCWTQTLFWSFILVGVTELIEAKRLWEIAVFQEIKGFWILLQGYSSPYLILISLSFPRHIVAVEIYLWKHFARGAPKYERFSVKSLGKRKN